MKLMNLILIAQYDKNVTKLTTQVYNNIFVLQLHQNPSRSLLKLKKLALERGGGKGLFPCPSPNVLPNLILQVHKFHSLSDCLTQISVSFSNFFFSGGGGHKETKFQCTMHGVLFLQQKFDN